MLNYAKSVKFRKLEKNAEQQEQDFKDVEVRAAWEVELALKNLEGFTRRNKIGKITQPSQRQ